MTDLHIIAMFRELIARGLIAAEPAPQSLPRGNADRKDATRSSWLVPLPAGGQAKLTLGRDLSILADRHAALARACPKITTAQLAHVRLPAGDALIESFFDGPTLESAASGRLLPPTTIRQGITRICAALAATERPSNASARAAEWNTWTGQLTALTAWQPAEAGSLQDLLLPRLYQRLAADPPVTRWTNGDFLPANILVDASGESCLIDAEFAARTHFFAEDAVRFQVLSPAVQEQPDLFAGLLPGRDLAWHLYFWLRQFQLEAGHNSPTYLARVQSGRLGLIRRLAEQVLDTPLPGWSTPALTVEYSVEDVRWLPEGGRTALISGWCHVPATRLRAIIALGRTGGASLVPPADRPDVREHFRDEPRALHSGFSLTIHARPENFPLTLCAMIDHGTLLPFQTLTPDDLPGGALVPEDYAAWAARHDPDPAAPASAPGPPGPLLSILLPVHKTPEAYLRASIGSVQAQHYTHWELCVVDDGSGSPGLTETLRQLAGAEPRIRVQTRKSNGGISRATNDALAMARGEFVVLLDHDDLFRPHTLAEFAHRLAREPALDALYSDEDKITADGKRLIPFLKPDYAPEFLLGVMYVGHALCVRASVARSVGGFDPAFDGIQDYEFFLRVTERTGRIGHIPRILYHWRQSPGSSALHGNAKGDMDQKQAQAVQAHLRRRSDSRTARPLGGHRVRLENSARPTMETIHEANPASALTALRKTATTSMAEVLVLLLTEAVKTPEAGLADLVALAALPDSGCVAPLLLSSEGRVYESGQAGSGPIMRGFHAESDGYHGSLRCNREVDAVSPVCIAVRRTLVVDAGQSLGEDWPGFCARLRAHGLYHRVCASSRVQLTVSCKDTFSPVTTVPGGREFYNPHFDSQRGDYTLAANTIGWASPEAGLQFFIDQPASWQGLARCVIIRGWCFAATGKSIQGVRLRANDLTLTGVVGLPRSDVKAALSEAPDDNTGFEIRGTLPSGRINLCLEARLADGIWHELMARNVEIKRQLLPLWLGGGDWMELMFFQMPAHMAYPARPVRREKFPAIKSNTPRPKFSIVTPSYNQARFLPETMRSVLEQDAAVDYVVQDGGSSDGSKALIERLAAEQGEAPLFAAANPVFVPGSRQGETEAKEKGEGKDRRFAAEGERRTENGNQKSEVGTPHSPSSLLPAPRLASWSSAPDEGQADAIAKGFAQTSGGPDDLMAWINSDDFYLPGALAYVADYFSRHPDVDVLYGHRIVVNEESQEIARWFLPRHDPEVLRLNDFVPQETLFWRRRIWDKAGGLDASFQFAMDWDLLLRFQAAGARIVRVPWFLACFRVHSAQKTSARMHDVGQREISLLRERTHGRPFPPHELETHPRLLRYLRRSAFIEFLWQLGMRAP